MPYTITTWVSNTPEGSAEMMNAHLRQNPDVKVIGATVAGAHDSDDGHSIFVGTLTYEWEE